MLVVPGRRILRGLGRSISGSFAELADHIGFGLTAFIWVALGHWSARQDSLEVAAGLSEIAECDHVAVDDDRLPRAMSTVLDHPLLPMANRS